MKKLLWLILVSFVVMPAYANTNMPSAPNYKPSTTATQPSQVYKKEVSNPYADILKEAQANQANAANKAKEDTSKAKKATSAKPTPQKAKINPNADRPYSEADKQKLDSLAMSALKAAENRKNKEMNEYLMEMVNYGADGFIQPQIIAKKTPHCPPIKLTVNGKQLSGKLCALTGYTYKGKKYEVGYCK